MLEEGGFEATTSMSSADAVTAERADVVGTVGANGSDPTGLAGSNNMTAFLRR